MCTNTLSARDYSLAQAAGRGNVVSFVGHDYLPLTNGVGFCDFVYGDSSLNSTCSRGMKSIGPGIKKKDGIMRGHLHASAYLCPSLDPRHVHYVHQRFAEEPCNFLVRALA
ncbi:hypothetical protein LEN26_018653 [Aphanomyces euteiches]|nr:hypothetical protein LEN26_018653 [Aphanomyces euteiches]KAH9112251.1 hypothetical protein AeMF1_013392 [Aphanomyces euteiches]KAH9188458.1 hypothetical protein AeNC1_009566 [Aphanomyces euteiches]